MIYSHILKVTNMPFTYFFIYRENKSNQTCKSAKTKYTDEPKHYDHLPNMLLVHRVLSKQQRPEFYKTPEGVLKYLAPRCLQEINLLV